MKVVPSEILAGKEKYIFPTVNSTLLLLFRRGTLPANTLFTINLSQG